MKKLFAMFAVAIALTGCHVVDTGHVGLRTNFDKTIEKTELVAGSFNQVLIGSVEDYPIREVADEVNDLQPQTKDNATMKDVDVSAIYNIHPACVSDLYINKSRSFHAQTQEGSTLLMYNYIHQLVRNAVYKEAREYDAMVMNDNRAKFEAGIKTVLDTMLAGEKLQDCITITQVQARALTPPDSLKAASDNLVRAKVENQTKDTEVSTAEKEAKRIAALNANAGAIEYMNAQSLALIAQGVSEGKVQTIVVPYDFKGIVNVGK